MLEIAIAFITGVISPVTVMVVKNKIENRKKVQCNWNILGKKPSE
jgi:hypothetical protein